jgi:hypothetical protein
MIILALVLIIVAILMGLGGLLLVGFKWLLIIAVICLAAGAVVGWLGRRRGGTPLPPG